MTAIDASSRIPGGLPPAAVVAGALVARLLELFGLPLVVGPFEGHAGHLATILLVVTAAMLYAGREPILLWVALGGCLDQQVFLVVEERHGYFAPVSVVGSVLFVGALLVAYALLHRASGRRAAPGARPGAGRQPGAWHFALVMAIVLAAFRGGQVLMRAAGVENEARSQYLWGYEIHHIHHGVLAIAVAALLLRFPPSASWRRAALLLLAVGIAFVVDQISYSALAEITDEAYFGSASLAGAALFAALTVCIVAIESRRLDH